ncbi:(4Fe-4S)-binding protein [Candidatus Fermentibacteria bacterium]|nr:MAG: (4Fe-4S)-binding protein [Candidatus Fermentibacteria bacterium]PIE52827.1 MAG: (4Fe-4S)-binding protein [Candidatus Fermentibacteria bacterium]
MILAVASGKGGTGKTTVAAALASAAECTVQYIDCDVEEPNGSIFLKPSVSSVEPVNMEIPVINENLCSSCGKCVRFCRFNALVSLGTTPLVFSELCHSCGGCAIVCPENAISWEEHETGHLSFGLTEKGISVIQGKLKVGTVMAPPVIRAARNAGGECALTVVDCPPGTSCPVIESLEGVDYVLLVTEPTPFGLHDLKLAVETVREIGIPCSVVINRCDEGDSGVENYCSRENLHVMLRIPHSRRMAEAYSRGGILTETMPELLNEFRSIPAKVKERLS